MLKIYVRISGRLFSGMGSTILKRVQNYIIVATLAIKYLWILTTLSIFAQNQQK